MKIPQDTYSIMLEAMRAVVNHYGKDLDWKWVGVWSIWWIAYGNLQYDDSHPFFKSGQWKRAVPHNPTFSLHDFTDAHIETSLRKIGKELGIL